METVKKFLNSKNWDFEELDDGKTIALGLQAEDIFFPVYFMKISDIDEKPYVRIVIVPYIEQPQEGYPIELYTTVLQTNHDLTNIKFSLDEDSDLELILDIRDEKLDEKIVDSSVDYITTMAVHYYKELSEYINI